LQAVILALPSQRPGPAHERIEPGMSISTGSSGVAMPAAPHCPKCVRKTAETVILGD
jgi:hypothetical protein